MTITERRQREKEQRRQRFIDVGQAVFFENGYDGSSIDAIAQRAEFSKRTVYLYFRDKRELFHAVVLRGLTRLNEVLSTSTPSDTNGIDRLNALADAYYRFFQEERSYFDLILEYELHDYHYAKPQAAMGHYARLCQEMNDRNSEQVATAVKQAIDEGNSGVQDLDAIQVTLILWGQVIGILQLIIRREEIFETAYGLSPESFFQRAFAVSMSGLFGPLDESK